MWRQFLCSATHRHASRIAGALLSLAVAGVGASDDRHDRESIAVQRLGADLFMAGGQVALRQPVTGDLLVLGGSVDVDAPVNGDAVAFGGTLQIAEDVGRSVYAGGGQLTLDAHVARTVRLVGGQLKLGPKSEVAGNLSAAGGQVRLLGKVHGNVLVAGGRVMIDGVVGGDIVAVAGGLSLGPNARVAGQLRYRSREPLQRDAAARVEGGVERIAVSLGDDDDADGGWRKGGLIVGVVVAVAAWTLGLLLLAGLVLALFPTASAQAGRRLLERPGLGLVLGFAALVCIPAAAVLLIVTVVGIPLGLFAMASYLALLPLATAIAGITLGDWGLRRWWPDSTARWRPRFAGAAVALLVLTLLVWIPWLGALVGLATLLTGLGALMLQIGAARTAGAA